MVIDGKSSTGPVVSHWILLASHSIAKSLSAEEAMENVAMNKLAKSYANHRRSREGQRRSSAND
ncbi:MAG: hypothetical protein IPL15_25350 [Comamonadaceae bacterium]|uniref:hypothetical protein n=1 Tax=Candidatus Skiveiella danica TaxID=3386177 RepID=UPI00390BD585|nr:hypothetical protein [Comamonadaceae bacterium]